jgi:hypothetical protein
MGLLYIQQFNLVIHYKKEGSENKKIDLLNHFLVSPLTVVDIRVPKYEHWKHHFPSNPYFFFVFHKFQSTIEVNQIPFLGFSIHEVWLYKIN